MRLTRELWERVSVVLDNALELPADTCNTYLDVACGNDPVLRMQVERLCGLHRELIGAVNREGPGPEPAAAPPMAERMITAVLSEGGGVDPELRPVLEPALNRVGEVDERLARVVEQRLFEPAQRGEARIRAEAPSEVDLRKALILLFAAMEEPEA